MLDRYLEQIQELRKANEAFAVALVVRREAPSSGKVGDRAVIRKNGALTGWVGGGCVRGIVVKEAVDAITTGKPRLVRIGKSLDDQKKAEAVMEYKMTCQSEGTVEVFVEPVLPQPHVVVMGKTEIAKALVKLAAASDFRVTAVAPDVNPQTFGKVDELITRYNLAQVKTSPGSFIVVATQGEDDEEALGEALGKESAYVGFVASRKKMAAVNNYLLAAGFSSHQVERIAAPAGIDINAKQPTEVAISILAEMIRIRNSDVYRAIPVAEEGTNETAPQYYINPVCGIPIDMANPKHIIQYKDEKVYFCCDGCKIKFEKDPEKYMQARAMGLEPEGM